MVSRANLTGRGKAGGVLNRVMNPRAAKIAAPGRLSGRSTPRPRPKGLAGLVAQGVDAAKTGVPMARPAVEPGGSVLSRFVQKANERSKAGTAPPANPPRARGLAGLVSTAAEKVSATNQPGASGVGGMVSRAAQQAKATQDAAVTQAQEVVDPNLGGTTTEQPTRNLPRRSRASRSGRIRSEFE